MPYHGKWTTRTSSAILGVGNKTPECITQIKGSCLATHSIYELDKACVRSSFSYHNQYFTAINYFKKLRKGITGKRREQILKVMSETLVVSVDDPHMKKNKISRKYDKCIYKYKNWI